MKADVLAPATEDDGRVSIACNLRLEQGDVVTKQLALTGPGASGVKVNCHGGSLSGGLLIRSGADGQQAKNIIIENCVVQNGIEIRSLFAAMEPHEQRVMSYQPDPEFRDWIRRTAPTEIYLLGLRIDGTGQTPLYITRGVTDVTLKDSIVQGYSNSVAIYLDAESAWNTIRDNEIHVKTDSREQIAIDGSRANLIVNNTIAELDDGGIFLYRNCGEDGIVRHTNPSENKIVNNVFIYREYSGRRPSIWLGSRNGSPGYCDEDDDADIGSGSSNLDYARLNVVAQNQIYKRALGEMILVGRPGSTDSPNFIAHNETVPEDEESERRAGCYMEGDPWESGHFYLDGQNSPTDNLVCNDGVWDAENAGIQGEPTLWSWQEVGGWHTAGRRVMSRRFWFV